ncbi:hypothetical protein HK098_005738 [Nowakowskiella sp. JEL0407]|nr:hypothetical protein HK098_005738 [Nowakowskiella sp. JEL0407]
MKLLKKVLEKDRSGFITLIAEEDEDMWHVYNLLQEGDNLKASTIRRVVSESATGSTDKTTVRVTLTIQVETVQFDTQAGMLRVNGRNVVENKHVKMGGYHTIELEKNKSFTISKPEWDIISLERIDEACNPINSAEIAAVVLEEGLASICLITSNMTIVRQKIELSIPRKRKGFTSNHDKSLVRFYELVYQGIIAHVDFNIIKVVILASPGFVRDQLYDHIFREAVRTENKVFIENKSKFIRVHCSSGRKHALQEVLQDPTVQNQLSDTKFSREVQTITRFYQMLGNDPSRAFYGYDHVAQAAERGAVEILMVTDGLFRYTYLVPFEEMLLTITFQRSKDLNERRKYIQLVEQVRAQGRETLIFSTLHVSGEQLSQLTGVAAILHFAMPDLEGESDEEVE